MQRQQVPHAQKRPAPSGTRRPERSRVRLGPSQARPRQPAVHRPSRPLRRHAGGLHARLRGVQGGGSGAARERHHRGGPGDCENRGEHQSEPADRPHRSGRRSDRRPLGGRYAAVPGGGHAGHSRRAASALPLPRPAPRQDPQQRRPAIESDLEHQAAHGRAGVSGVPDADSDVELARRVRATTWCRAAFIRASSTRCRRRRSSSSSS